MRSVIKSIRNPFRSLAAVILILVGLCIILPVISLIRLIYARSVTQFEQSLIKASVTETSSYARLLEQDLDSIRLQTIDILTNRLLSVLPLRFEAGTQSTRFALELQTVQSHLQAVQNSYNIIDSMTLYYPKQNRQITQASQSPYSNRQKEQLTDILSESNQTGIWISSDRLAFWSASPFNNRSRYENTNAIVVTMITSGKVSKYLTQYKGIGSDSHFALAMEEESKVFASTSNTFYHLKLPEYASSNYSIIKINGINYLLSQAPLGDLKMTLYQLTPFNQISAPLHEYKRAMLLFSGILLFSAITFTLLLYLMIYKPISHARHIFSRMETGELGVQMGSAWYSEFQNMYRQFDSMSAYLQHLIEQEYELRLLNSKAQLKQLQYQISPHFLYNTYFILRGLMQEEEYEKALLLSDVIGRYLKYITASDQDIATLGEELEHAAAYAQIQQIRFARRVSIYFSDCSAEWQKLMIPRLVIQPLIENAFDHGVRDKITGGLIQIGFAYAEGSLTVTVEDNGESLTEESLQKLSEMLLKKDLSVQDGVALYNIHKRLTLMYPAGSGLAVSRSSLGGLRCTLKIIFDGG